MEPRRLNGDIGDSKVFIFNRISRKKGRE